MSLLRRASFLVLLVGPLAVSAHADPRLAVIVHPHQLVNLTIVDVRQIYLKKRRYWPDGRPIIPINRDAGSDSRARFSRVVFGPLLDRMPVYWKRLYFQGVLPPATLASSAAVKRFVAAEPNAIGYLEADDLDDSVRVVIYLK